MDVCMLVSKAHPLPEDFRPDGLIDLYSLEDRHFFLPPRRMLLVEEAARALNRMCAAAAREEGLTDYYVFSAWRSREELIRAAQSGDQTYAVAPECSEEGTGLCVGIEAAVPDILLLHLDWLEKNSWRYGYIQRYPAGREQITERPYQPWHFRYVGEELAAVLFRNHWTLEEYYDRSIPPADPHDPAYIFISIFGAKMKGHWQNWPEIDLEDLRRVNPAAEGWVHMDGTPIDYPVVGQELSRAWCLTHNFSGEPSAHGMIRLTRMPGTGDLLLYGHHMRDTSMFMKLDELRAAGSFQAHPVMELILEEGRYTARWFAALLLDRGKIPMPDSADPGQRAEWLRSIRGQSVCVSDTAAAPEDRILCCATCAPLPMQSVLYAVLRPAHQRGRPDPVRKHGKQKKRMEG